MTFPINTLTTDLMRSCLRKNNQNSRSRTNNFLLNDTFNQLSIPFSTSERIRKLKFAFNKSRQFTKCHHVRMSNSLSEQFGRRSYCTKVYDTRHSSFSAIKFSVKSRKRRLYKALNEDQGILYMDF
jgi:hypothetical protein